MTDPPPLASPSPAGRIPLGDRAATAGSSAPPEAASADLSARFGKFVRTVRLGSGGGGEVWKAWDTNLARWVALKFLRGGDAEEIARFKREAQTSAKLAHANIAAVYEVGEDQARHYIAMQFIDGRTLRGMRFDSRSVATFVRDAARAVSYAHDNGILHRDLKPDNLMVELPARRQTAASGSAPPLRDAGAGGRLYVMDFGLARVVGEKGLSTHGRVIGTPNYMSPEQSRGESLDGRTDVYSLGATLYELATGNVPFAAPNVYETLRKLQEEAPPAMRGVEPDLETIILKCLEKERERRYASAAELADELDRFLRGEPVRAHRPSLIYRAQKAVTKWRTAFATGLVALAVVALVAGAVWLRLRVRAATVAQAKETLLREMRSTASTCLSAALDLRRSGDVAGMQRYAEKLEEVCRRVTKELPGLPEPHYLLGRLYRAQMRDGDARREQEEALRLQPDCAGALYERIILVARDYRRRSIDAVAEAWREEGMRMSRDGSVVRPPSVSDVVKGDESAASMKRLIDADLHALLHGPSALDAGELACARALEAWTAGRFDEARRGLAEAIRIAPALDEAHQALAQLEYDCERFEESAAVCTTAMEGDRGYLPFVESRAEARLMHALVLQRATRPCEAAFKAAIDDCEEVARRSQGTVRPLVLLASATMSYGLAVESRREDPSALYRKSIDGYTAALAIDPRDDDLWKRRGGVHANLGVRIWRRRGDPRAEYEAAIRDLDESVKRNPDNSQAWEWRGNVNLNWAAYDSGLGGDPRPRLHEAIRDYEEAIHRHPGRSESWFYLGSALCEGAQAESQRGVNPEASYEAAARAFAEAAKLDARFAMLWFRWGQMETTWAMYTASRGDPGSHYAAALRCFDEADRREPAAAESLLWRGNANLHWAAWEAENGSDPSAHYGAAAEAFDEAIEIDPNRFELRRNRAISRLNLACWLAEHGDDPTGLCRQAIEDFSHAMLLRRTNGEVVAFRGNAWQTIGVWRVRQGAGGGKELRAALQDYADAVRVTPTVEEMVKTPRERVKKILDSHPDD